MVSLVHAHIGASIGSDNAKLLKNRTFEADAVTACGKAFAFEAGWITDLVAHVNR